MLYRKIRMLPSTCMLLTTESNSGPVFNLIKRCISCSSYMQLSQNKTEWTDDITNFDQIESNDQISSIYEKYIQHVNPKFRNKVLQNYMSLNIDDSDPYLISRKVGNDFVTLIKDDLQKNMTHVIELNPGFGLLTENLLQAGIPFVNLYEKNIEFYPELHILNKKFPNRFNIRKANLFKLSKMLNLNATAIVDTDVCKILNNVPEKKWEEDSCMQVIGTTTKHIFIRHLIMSTVFQTGFMIYGRPIFYLALSPSVWNKFTSCTRRITTRNVMFNILFNYKMFGTLDRKAFVPWQKKKKAAKPYKNLLLEDDNHILFVVKFEPKSDLFTLFDGKKDLIHFWHFVRHHLYKPSQRVIPALEKIIPGCGVRLIEKNYNIYTEFGRLSYKQIYDLYSEFKSWPEFKESAFLLSAREVKKTYELYTDEEYE